MPRMGQRLAAPLLFVFCFISSAVAQGINGTGLGTLSDPSGANAVALGVQAIASGDNATATGTQSSAYGANSAAYGVLSQAAENGTALGNLSRATGANSTSVGILSMASESDASAFGNQSVATGRISAAFGALAEASGERGVALGGQSAALGADSVAIGAGSIASEARTVSMGAPGAARRITNVADGESPGDVVTVRQQTAALAQTRATQAAEYQSLSQDITATRVAVAPLQSQIDALGGSIAAVSREARAGIAGSAALAPVIVPSAPGRTTLSFNSAFYRGQVGIGIGVAHRLNTDWPITLHGSYANGGGREHLGRAGVALEF